MRRTEQVQGRLMKFEEVYGRTHRGGLSQAEAAEVLGVSERTFRRWRTATRRREPTVSTTAAWAASRRGARRWTRWRGCWRCSTPATGTSRPSTSTRSWWPITASSAAQLAAAELASPWAQARGAQAWGAPAQAAAPCPARHDVAPGRLEPRVGPRSMVGPASPWTMRPAISTRPSSSPKRAPCRASRGCPRRSGPRACSARSTPTAPATTGTRPRRRQGGQGHPDPSAGPGAARHR